MSEPLVLVADTGPVRTITLNRPAALNSFTGAMHAQLREALDAAAAEASVRAVAMRAGGGLVKSTRLPTFCCARPNRLLPSNCSA